jgi:hypothetical protein
MKKFLAFVVILSLGLFCAVGCPKKAETNKETKPAAGEMEKAKPAEAAPAKEEAKPGEAAPAKEEPKPEAPKPEEKKP